MAEVLHQNLEEIKQSDILNKLNLEPKKYILLSAHREENIDTEKNFLSLFTAINKLAEKYDMPILEGKYKGQYDWLTQTFRYGGADLMMREVRECSKVDVERYIRVNFTTFKKGIDSVGGIDITLTAAETEYVNTGTGRKTYTEGENHLDSTAALVYARCRHIDSDWHRIERQRNVIQAVVTKTKDLSVTEVNTLLNNVLPLVQTNLTKLEITELLLLAPKCRGAEIKQTTIPVSGSYGGMRRLGGRSLFSVDFDANAKALREFIYGIKAEN